MNLQERVESKSKNKIINECCPFPTNNLLIEVTNCCNNKCIFCYNRYMKREKKFINKNLCERVLKEAFELGMREVGFYVTGEPLLDKRLSAFISFAKSIGYNYIYITTNGILANLKEVEKLYNSGLNSIKYSINATNRDNYIKIHGTDNYDVVINNLIEVYNWKKKNNLDLKVYVSYIYTDFTYNKKEINDIFKNICDEYITMPAVNQGGLIPNVKKISTFDSSINSFSLPCSYPFNSVIVTVEGYLTACCMDFENFLAYANLNKSSLKECWNNRIISSFRKKHLEKDVSGTICENCIYNSTSIPKPLNKKLFKLKRTDNIIFGEYINDDLKGVIK